VAGGVTTAAPLNAPPRGVRETSTIEFEKQGLGPERTTNEQQFFHWRLVCMGANGSSTPTVAEQDYGTEPEADAARRYVRGKPVSGPNLPVLTPSHSHSH